MITITKKDLAALGSELSQPNVGSLQVSGSLDKLYVEHYSNAGARLSYSFIELDEYIADVEVSMITPEQANRVQRMMQEYASGGSANDEPVRVEQITASLYVFGSELACLRIFAKYNARGAAHCPKARVGYSTNMLSWFFVLEDALSSDSDGPRKAPNANDKGGAA